MDSQQGSNSWHDWRKKGIGASDVPILLGLSPWKTPLELFNEKTNQTKPDAKSSGNFATIRGQWLEQEARTQYELLADCDMPPILVVHPEYPYMRASLDGYNIELSRVLEIKCPGKEDHKTAMAGKVPEKYYPQVQYQLLVTGAKEAHYYSFDGEQGCVVEVKPDAEYQAMLIEKVKHFWEDHVLKGVPPAPTKADKVFVTDSKGVELFSAYKALKAKIDVLTDELTSIKNEIVQRFGGEGRPVECAGVQLMFQTRKGSVDLESVTELQGVDLSKYRKPDTHIPILRVISE